MNAPFVNVTGVSYVQNLLIYRVTIPVASMSIFASMTAVITFFIIRHYLPDFSDRVSFRLSAATNISDGFFAFFAILSVTYYKPGFWCAVTAWGWVFFSLVSMFFTLCIAINLQAIFIHEYKGRHNFEKYYFTISILFALFLSLLPLSQNMYGYDDPEAVCWFRDSGQRYNIIWQWTVLFCWLTLSILYCALVVIAVIIKLRSATYGFNQILDTLPHTTPSKRQFIRSIKQKTLISAIVRKVMWYPIIPIITQFSNFWVETNVYVNRTVSFELLLLCYVTASSQGCLNALVFSQDIAVTRAIQSLRAYWWRTYVNVFEERYPHLSRNKSFPCQKGVNADQTISLPTQGVTENPTTLEWIRYILIVTLFHAPSENDETFDLIASTSKVVSLKIDESNPKALSNQLQMLAKARADIQTAYDPQNISPPHIHLQSRLSDQCQTFPNRDHTLSEEIKDFLTIDITQQVPSQCGTNINRSSISLLSGTGTTNNNTIITLDMSKNSMVDTVTCPSEQQLVSTPGQQIDLIDSSYEYTLKKL